MSDERACIDHRARHALGEFQRQISRMEGRLENAYLLIHRLEERMSDTQTQQQQLDAALANLQQAEAAEKTRVQAQLDALNATVASLQAKQGQGGPDISSEIAAIQAVATDLGSAFPDATPAPTDGSAAPASG